MLERYRKVFAEFDKEPDRQAQGRILQFKSYLGDSLNVLNKLAETCVKMQEVSKNSIEKKLSMIQFVLPDYEKACLLENDQRRKADNLLFSCSKGNGVEEAINVYKKLTTFPAVLMISEEIKREQREI